MSQYLGNGWAPAVPPYITYPVQNVAWGNNTERPPYAPAKFIPQGQTMLTPKPVMDVNARNQALPQVRTAARQIPGQPNVGPPKNWVYPLPPKQKPVEPTVMEVAPSPLTASPGAPLPVQDWFNLLRS